MTDINDLTFRQIKEIHTLAQQIQTQQPTSTAFELGKSYFIRTATYHVVGRLIAIYPEELVLEEASWVADSGRFHTALKTGELNEVEPFVNPCIVFRGGGIDATEWSHPLPGKQK